MTRTYRLSLLLPLLLVVVSGCISSSTPSQVHGKVTYKGQALPAGSVTFQLSEGGIFTYPIQPDGTYSGTDLPAGEYVVTVETESANPNAKKATYEKKGKEGGDPNDYRKRMQERGQVPEGAGNKGSYVKIPA